MQQQLLLIPKLNKRINNNNESNGRFNNIYNDNDKQMTPDTGIFESAARSSVTNYHLNSSTNNNDNIKQRENTNSNCFRHNQMTTDECFNKTNNIPINHKINNNCIAVGLSNAVNLAVQDASNAITNYLSSSSSTSLSGPTTTVGKHCQTMTSQIFNHNLNNNKRKQTKMLPIQMINSSTQNSVKHTNNTFSSSSDDSSNLIINNNQHQYVPLTVSKVPKTASAVSGTVSV